MFIIVFMSLQHLRIWIVVFIYIYMFICPLYQQRELVWRYPIRAACTMRVQYVRAHPPYWGARYSNGTLWRVVVSGCLLDRQRAPTSSCDARSSHLSSAMICFWTHCLHAKNLESLSQSFSHSAADRIHILSLLPFVFVETNKRNVD